MKKFEYIVTAKPMSEKDLNDFGKVGWRLVSYSVVGTTEKYIFEKEIHEQ